jgi:RNA polymerase sigma factor (sigma-70 family)
MAKYVSLNSGDDFDTPVSLIERLTKQPDDHDAWSRFVDRYGPLILGWCRSWRLQDADAHNLTQIVLTKLLSNLRRFKYDPSRSFRGWLRKVTENAWTESIRNPWPVIPGGDYRIDRVIEGHEAREDLFKRIESEFDLELMEMAEKDVRDRVEPQTWEAYWLTAVEGLAGLEVSRRLGMSVTNVFAARHKVLKLLKKEVKTLQNRQKYH